MTNPYEVQDRVARLEAKVAKLEDPIPAAAGSWFWKLTGAIALGCTAAVLFYLFVMWLFARAMMRGFVPF